MRTYYSRVAMTVVAALLVSLATVLGSPAAVAAGGNLGQSGNTGTSVLKGQAVTDHLSMTGTDGEVTYRKTAGDDIAVTDDGSVSTDSALGAGRYVASGTASDTHGNTGTWTYTVLVAAPAPATFLDKAADVYASGYDVAKTLGQSDGLQSIAQYTAGLHALTDLQLAQFYYVTQQVPQWSQIPALMQTVASGISPATVAPLNQGGPASTMASTVAPRAAGGPVRAAAAVVRPRAVTVAPYEPTTCPNGIPSSTIFALQIVVQVSAGAFNVASSLPLADDAIGVKSAIAIPLAGLLLAVSVAHDTLAYLQELNDDCEKENLASAVNNVDGSTVQVFNLVTEVAGAVTQVQTTQNSTLEEVQAVHTELTALQSTIQNATSNQTVTLQKAISNNSQELVDKLQVQIDAMNQNLTEIADNRETVNQQILTQVNSTSKATDTAITSALTQILAETNTDAQNLSDQMTANTQRILNSLDSKFATQQDQYQDDLRLRIQTALASDGILGTLTGSVRPLVQFVLPASRGGYFDSTPVGVVQVMEDALTDLAAAGVTISKTALSACSTARQAAAAKSYVRAFHLFAGCYQLLPL